MDDILELKALVEHLSHGTSNSMKVNDTMTLLEDDLNNTLETLKIVPNYNDEEEVYDAVRTGVFSYLELGINYHSFVNSLALVKKHLLLLQDNDSDDYVNKMSIELVRIFRKLQINPQKRVAEFIKTKKINYLISISIPYVLGVVTGVTLSMLVQ